MRARAFAFSSARSAGIAAPLALSYALSLAACARGVAVQGSGGGASTSTTGATAPSGASTTGTATAGASTTGAGATTSGASGSSASSSGASTGTGGTCTSTSQCAAGLACVGGVCGACHLSSQCTTGNVCSFGLCTPGSLVQMYQCPGVTSLGGGAWGFYGCQNQITNTPTCNEIESPTTQNFPCTPIGKMAILTGSSPAPAGTSYVGLYQCPGVTSLGGGSWGFYGCQNQITNTPTCNEIESPTTQNFPCTPIGKMAMMTAPPPPPAGGQNVPMYQCPGVTSLGGGSWGFYGCQSQITNTPTCNEIEYPNNQNFPCTPVGSIALEP